MDDIWSIIVAISTALTALFLSFTWYWTYKERKDKVLVTRFMEGTNWFINVKPKRNNMVEDCSVFFDKKELLTKDTGMNSKLIDVGGNDNFMFWAGDRPNKDDAREIIVKERGNIIFKKRTISKSKFKDLYQTR